MLRPLSVDRRVPRDDRGASWTLASAGLTCSFERHLRAKNLSDGTVASYLVGVRQFTAFRQPRGRALA